MTIQELGSLGELIAAIATLVTLIYLATQIRQNTRLLKANSAVAHTASSNEGASLLAQSPALCELYFGGLAGSYDFGPGERRQFEMLVGIFMNHIQLNCDLQEQGVLSASFEQELDGQIAWIVSQPGFRQYWEAWGPSHSPTARRHVERAMAAQAPA